MVNSLKINLIAMMVTSIFTVFNTGIPLIIASCPMIGQSHHGSCCCMTQTHQSQPVIKKEWNYSCCKTIIMAERNKTEFLQGSEKCCKPKEIRSAAGDASMLRSVVSGELPSFTSILSINLHSPPPSNTSRYPILRC